MNKDKNSTDDLFDDMVYTDDAIFAKAIANQVRKQPISRFSILPK